MTSCSPHKLSSSWGLGHQGMTAVGTAGGRSLYAPECDPTPGVGTPPPPCPPPLQRVAPSPTIHPSPPPPPPPAAGGRAQTFSDELRLMINKGVVLRPSDEDALHCIAGGVAVRLAGPPALLRLLKGGACGAPFAFNDMPFEVDTIVLLAIRVSGGRWAPGAHGVDTHSPRRAGVWETPVWGTARPFCHRGHFLSAFRLSPTGPMFSWTLLLSGRRADFFGGGGGGMSPSHPLCPPPPSLRRPLCNERGAAYHVRRRRVDRDAALEGGGGVGTRPRYLIVCLWRRLLASRRCASRSSVSCLGGGALHSGPFCHGRRPAGGHKPSPMSCDS